MSGLGVSTRVSSPRSARLVTATRPCPPLQASRASTTGCRRQGCPGSWRVWSRRGRRSGCACTARTASWKTIWGAGVAPTTAASPRRGAGPPVAWPVSRLSRPPPQRVAPALGGLESPHGVFTRPAPIAHGVVFALWHIDGREGPRAQEARPSDGVTTVGVAPSARLCRPQGRGHDPARLACVTHGAREPIPARAGFVDNDEVLTFRLPRTDAVIAVTLTRAPGPEIGDLSPVLVSDRRHRAGCCMDLSTAVEWVRGCQG
jgi:hypothetical protein